MRENFKEIMLCGTHTIVPQVKNVSRHLWKKPIPTDITDKIKNKNKCWQKYLTKKDSKVYEQYKKARNDVRNTTRGLFKEEKLELLMTVSLILNSIGTILIVRPNCAALSGI